MAGLWLSNSSLSTGTGLSYFAGLSQGGGLSPDAGGSLPPLLLSASTILDKSASGTSVGTLANLIGTPVMTDSAGGRFVVTSSGEVRVGLVIPDRGVSTSHSITISDNGGARSTSFTITVTAITAATSLSTAGSIRFPRRNGETAQNFIGTTAGLFGLFGANVANGADGAIAFFFNVARGSLVTTSTDLDINSSPYIMGTHSGTSGRGFAVRYFPEDASAATGTALKGRLCFNGGDHASVNRLGLYLTTDADGTPTGSASTNSWLRSAVITDDVPRLVVLRYTSAGTTWGGTAYGARTFQVITVRLDDFTIEYGDTKTLAAWVGMGTNAARTNAIGVGTFNSGGGTTGVIGAASSVANYFPGEISGLTIASASGTDTNWQNIARGVLPSTELGSSAIQYYWPLTDPSDLTQASGTQTASSFVASGAISQGSPLRPSINVSANGLRSYPNGRGYVFGLRTDGATSRNITERVTIIGATTHIQARVYRQSDNALMLDWTRVTTTPVNGNQTLTIPALPIGYDYVIETRREDDNTIVSVNRSGVRVGYKFALVGQSQDDIAIFKTGTGASAATATNLSFVVQRARTSKSRRVDVCSFEALGDLSAGMAAMMERLSAIAPTVPFSIMNMCQSGESLGTFYSDQIVYSGTTYRAWGDNVTLGSGLFTDLMLVGGGDISGFIHMHGTADIGRNAIYGSLLNALYAGIGDGNEVFSNTPSLGGPTVTTSIVRSFATAPLSYPTRIFMMPISRHAYVATGAGALQSAFDTFRDNYQNMRNVQRTWVPAGGLTSTVAAYLHDMKMEFSTDTAHQGASEQQGNMRFGQRLAFIMLGASGFSNYAPSPALTSATRAGNVITLATSRPNGGSLFTPGGGAPVGFEVNEGGGWTSAGFTTAISGTGVTLTKGSAWAAGTQVRYAYGGPIGYFTVSQSQATRDANFALENADLPNMLYESRADAAPANTSTIVQGVPLIPTFTNLVAA